MTDKPKPLRCAIYTRKSSEEGLEQSFNSLDAQREACEAYVLSQTSEGWSALGAQYDDGGYSGGNMERPGLKQLLEDIAAGHLDIVVVYKIDRLTRSLADFARIVEIFEAAKVSFVSVTQSFNTTSSMGRLMLNVLLSFAQFEREVTGERIRDKITASKAKGMWMGGTLPMGYDRPITGTHILLTNRQEAGTVRHIFARYLVLGSVHALQRELASQHVCSKLRTTLKGRIMGGTSFSRGALFYLLRNRVYLGKIVHKQAVYDGGHEAIVDQTLFDDVQARLDAQRRRHKNAGGRRSVKAPLTAKLFDAAGEPMSPTTARGKSGRTYHYYVSSSLQKGAAASNDETILQRLPARDIESIITQAVRRWLPAINDVFEVIRAVRIGRKGLHIQLTGSRISGVASRLLEGEEIIERATGHLTVLLPLALPMRGGPRKIMALHHRTAKPDPHLVTALRRARRMLEHDNKLPVLQNAPTAPYERNILRLAFLAPDIQQAILKGLQPAGLNLQKLKAMTIPLEWTQQRQLLGFDRAAYPVKYE